MLNRLGEIALEANKLEDARARFDEALVIARKLAKRTRAPRGPSATSASAWSRWARS